MGGVFWGVCGGDDGGTDETASFTGGQVNGPKKHVVDVINLFVLD